MKAPVIFFCLLSWLFYGSAAAQPVDRNNICSGLEPSEGQIAELYFRAIDGEIRPFRTATLLDIQGRRIALCYVSNRTEWDLPDGLPQRGALNIKIELVGEPDARDVVSMYNNHIMRDQLCTSRTFQTYQAFHEDGTLSHCLRYGFHNSPGDFSTFEPEDRRKLFLFPPRTLFERIFDYDSDKMPVKRMSLIFNYAVLPDLSTVRVPFYFTASRDVTAVNFVLDDLLETNFNQRLPRIRLTFRERN